MLRLARFLRGYSRPARGLRERDVSIESAGGHLEATLVEPAERRSPPPGWVVLHGITVPGRRHPVLMRFVRALASSGSVVLVPEVPPWKALEIDPDAADLVVGAAARHLAESGIVRAGGVGLVGFSFGATQALMTASRPELRSVIRSVVGFGGYCDLRRTVRFMMVGEHEWEGVRYTADPDPYGRWIVAANYLPRARGFEGTEAVARAAAALAAEAGRRFDYAGDASYDRLKREHRDRLDPGHRELWDVLAPPAGAPIQREMAIELGERLVDAALEQHPHLDPRSDLHRLDRRVVLAHGREDLLIPFTETLRLRTHLVAPAPARIAVTRLFAHSTAADPLRPHEYPIEAYRYLRLLSAAFG